MRQHIVFKYLETNFYRLMWFSRKRFKLLYYDILTITKTFCCVLMLDNKFTWNKKKIIWFLKWHKSKTIQFWNENLLKSQLFYISLWISLDSHQFLLSNIVKLRYSYRICNFTQKISISSKNVVNIYEINTLLIEDLFKKLGLDCRVWQ